MRRRRTKTWLAAAALWFALLPGAAMAGGGCDPSPVAPETLAAAADTAVRVASALEARDAPVALVARVGTDLSNQGLVYSHAGFAVRDHAAGRWSVVHLLNTCGSDRSALYVQGLVNFFADDLVNQDARIVWLQPELAQRLATHLQASAGNALHHPRYSIIARPGSRDYQNSTAWILETLAAQHLDPSLPASREAAYAQGLATGFEPDHIRIAYARRVIGGLFAVNAAFTDHPVGTRLSGRYPVVTVRSILHWLESRGDAIEQREWRNGQLQPRPGPA